MAVISPTFSGTTGPYTAASSIKVLSTIKGGPYYPTNIIGSTPTVTYSTFEKVTGASGGATYTYELKVYPEYAGQLMWTNVMTPEATVTGVTPYTARLFLAVPAGIDETDPETGRIIFLKWVPVFSSFALENPYRIVAAI